jgi:hypothetical protein
MALLRLPGPLRLLGASPLLASLRHQLCAAAPLRRGLHIPSTLAALARPALQRPAAAALPAAQRAPSGQLRLLPTLGQRWESTRRKRMKAMTKHKYEKRQKKIRNLTALNQNRKK